MLGSLVFLVFVCFCVGLGGFYVRHKEVRCCRGGARDAGEDLIRTPGFTEDFVRPLIRAVRAARFRCYCPRRATPTLQPSSGVT